MKNFTTILFFAIAMICIIYIVISIYLFEPLRAIAGTIALAVSMIVIDRLIDDGEFSGKDK